MRAKNAITDKMLKIQQEMEVCSTMLNQESQAHVMTRDSMTAAKMKLEVSPFQLYIKQYLRTELYFTAE